MRNLLRALLAALLSLTGWLAAYPGGALERWSLGTFPWATRSAGASLEALTGAEPLTIWVVPATVLLLVAVSAKAARGMPSVYVIAAMMTFLPAAAMCRLLVGSRSAVSDFLTSPEMSFNAPWAATALTWIFAAAIAATAVRGVAVRSARGN